MRPLALTMLLLIGVAASASAQRYLFKQPDASSAPSIAVTDAEVRVEGTSPGGNVILYSAALNTLDGITVERSAARTLTDPDNDGITRFLAKVPLRSVWIAIDYLTGKHTIGSRSGFTITPLLVALGALKADLEGVIGIIDQQQLAAELLIVRPGKGAWTLRAFEGGNGDADATRNGRLSLPAETATPVAGTTDPPPKRLREGDVLALIDPMRLEVFVRTITK